MKIKRRVAIIAIALTLVSSCAAWDALTAFQPKPSVELNANVGKNVKQNKTGIGLNGGGNSEQTADTITNNQKTEYKAEMVNQTYEKVPPWLIILLVLFAGFVIPSAGATLKFLGKSIKTLGNFILKLFGKNKPPDEQQEEKAKEEEK